MMRRFFGTFGTGQEYAGCYVEIIADDEHCATIFMLKAHGQRWSSVYSEKEFSGHVEKYGVMKLATVQQRPAAEAEEVYFDVIRENRHVRH